MIFKQTQNMNHIISPKKLTLDIVKTIINEGMKLKLGEEAEAAIIKCRKYLTSDDLYMALLQDSDHYATSPYLPRICLSFSTISSCRMHAAQERPCVLR